MISRVSLMRRFMREENRKHGRKMERQTQGLDCIDKELLTATPVAVWRSSEFLAVEYLEGEHSRISVCRCSIRADGKWSDGITWDDLQKIKSEIGYGDTVAMEIFPRDSDVVNVANMRHLWLVPGGVSFGWPAVEVVA